MPRIRGSHRALELQIPRLLAPSVPLSRALFATMRFLTSRAAGIPGPSGSLCALLVLLLLTPPGPLASAGPVAAIVRELRCMCLTTTPGIHPKMISNLQVIAPGPQCSKVEVVAALKNGKEVCLDPNAPLIKKVIQKMLDSEKKN
ncbi:LOW QUALITY PROTEIN: C-X-C motif chemokine 6-like [Hippopotamus amphibius kiboko]|uniref:LOW QUALITY PROTEIN: C-X-C motif chemokine 6-like n=1 Tax=Hippopotamus amphibius kiboko TaxID=575201 RepID=UPI0025985280|nr:LOW QUALITY PROTEIN: C-X-C motif chemokine 6-like [Hippopotamus amphibius kiboko]